MTTAKILIKYKGGKGSGHRGHSGRPGKVGGSVSGAGGSAVKSTADSTMEEIVSYETFAGSDKEMFVQVAFEQLAEDLGIDTKIKVVSDKEFNELFKSAKISQFGEAMGGARTITAGYRIDTNEMYIRRSNVEKINSSNDYRLFRNSVYHELGHAYHTDVWNVKGALLREEVYGTGWAETFATAFASKLSIADAVARVRTDPRAAGRRSMKPWVKLSATYNMTDEMNTFLAAKDPR